MSNAGIFMGSTEKTLCKCGLDAFVLNPYTKEFSCGECVMREAIKQGYSGVVPDRLK